MLSDDSDGGSSKSEVYEVDQILGMRVLDNGTEEFKVRWKNYGSNDDTWEPKENLNGAKNTLKKFLQSTKAKGLGEKTAKGSRALIIKKSGKAQARKRENSHGSEVRLDRSSNEDEPDDDFNGLSASKKKKKKAIGKTPKKASSRIATGRARSTFTSRPTPRKGDSLTMAISQRMNLGQHSSWLDSGSESDSNLTKKSRAAGGAGRKGAADCEKDTAGATNGDDNKDTTMQTNDDKHRDYEDRPEISDDSTATEKLANSPSPHFDNEARGVNDTRNLPSEHDLPANMSTLLNGTTAAARANEQNSKRVGHAQEKATTLHFDGIYFDGNDQWKLGVRSEGDASRKNIRVFTFQEAAETDSRGLCEFLKGLVTFTKDGSPRIEVKQRVEELVTQCAEELTDNEKTHTREDGKLNIDE